MTSQKPNDWRGNSQRFRSTSLQDQESMQQLLESVMRAQPTRMCEMLSENGSVECRFLSSALSHWQMFIGDQISKQGDGKRGEYTNESFDAPATKQLVSRGMASGIILIATCQECKRHRKLSTTLLKEQMDALSLRNLAPSQPAAIFISWRLEIGNTFQAGRWGMSLL
jgi:hypothetical protein